jgi:hypothetical protein
LKGRVNSMGIECSEDFETGSALSPNLHPQANLELAITICYEMDKQIERFI